jgi:predicted nucleic acid-binding protein
VTLVVDASVVVAALVDDGPDGRWAEAQLATGGLVAPHLLPAEVAKVLRRAAATGDLSDDLAALAHADLVDLDIDLFAYEPFADRVWALRHGVSAYDAWYVALAESLEADLATLDRRLARSPSATCRFRTPPT